MNLLLLGAAALLILYAGNGLIARSSTRKRTVRLPGGVTRRFAVADRVRRGPAVESDTTPRQQVTASPADVTRGILSAVLVLCGVLLMQRTDSAPLLAGLPTGVLAGAFPHPSWIIVGTIVSVLGCIGVFRWLPGYLPWELNTNQPRSAQSAASEALSLRGPSRAAIAIGLAGLVLYGFVLLHTHSTQAGVLVMLCLVASVALFGLTLRRMRRGTNTDASQPGLGLSLTWLDGLAIVAVIAAFIIVNAHDLRSWVFAYIGDEWPFYALAKSIANGAPFDPLSQAGVYGYHPVVDSLYQGLVMRVAGLNVDGWKMSSILATALAVIPLYWVAKRMGGSLFATAASIIYAACPLLWAFSHIGYNEEDPLPAMILAAALCFIALRRDSPVLLYAAGACAGAGWYTLFTGRLMIGVLVAVLLTEWRGGWPAFWRRLAFLLGGFAIVVVPLFLDNGAATIKQMLPLASVATGSRAVLPASVLVPQNTVRGIYAFLYATVDDHYTAGALFDVISAAALCIGVTVALRRLRSLSSRVLLLWFALLTALTTPLYYVPQIAGTRSMIIVPPAALLAALGLCAVCRAIGLAWVRPKGAVLFAVSMAGALCAVILLNGYHDYGYVTLLPRYWPPYPVVVSTMEAITTLPRSTFVLPADMPTQNPNGDLCLVLDGFQVDPTTVLRFNNKQPVPYCSPTAPPRRLALSTHVVLLVDAVQTMQRCVAQPTVTYIENQATLWGYRLRVPAQPAADYAARIGHLALQTCPTLAG